MNPKLPTLSAVAALVIGATACGTLGKHYGDEAGGSPSSPSIERAEPAIAMAHILVDSIPSGAIIKVNGIRVGRGPVFAQPELDSGGALITDLDIAADYTMSGIPRTTPETLLPRNVPEIVSARYRSGDLPPRRLSLARQSDGGIASFGGPLPGN